jgi:hypothetical protein
MDIVAAVGDSGGGDGAGVATVAAADWFAGGGEYAAFHEGDLRESAAGLYEGVQGQGVAGSSTTDARRADTIQPVAPAEHE